MSQIAANLATAAEETPSAEADDVKTVRGVLVSRPNWAPGHFALAQALERRGQWHAAIASYERTVEIKPHCVEAHEALAALLARLRQLDEARQHYEQAVALVPDNHRIQTNLGALLQELGQLEAAIACHERALRIAPDCLEAHVNLAAARMKLRQFDAAAAGLERALEFLPESIELHNRLGHALLSIGRLADAKRHYGAAIRLQPDKALWRLRLDLLGPAVLESNAQIDEYQESLAERLAAYGDERRKFDVNELATSGCQPPVELAYQGRDDLAIRKSLARIFENSLPPTPPKRGSGKPSLAFFVPKGSEGIFLRGMAGVLARLSPERFRTTVVCSPRGIAPIKAAVADSPIDYLPLSPTLRETIDNVRAERFDLAYFWEVGTDSMSYFLPFFRLAAVQSTSWGWPVTSGIAAMDYFISSDLLEPADAESHYSERLIRLKHIPNYYPRPTWPAPRANRDRFGLRPDQQVYVCAQNPWKIQPDFDFLAGEILRRDPRGVLLLVEARWPHV
ncbi:MAG TPA: tetratricopeptide repeat protein, partial [Pirellulales bacterium]|nr:tetratricopeptide repeat protein [Pirellulales bacterium]